MARHAGPRDDVKDADNYSPTHATPKWGEKDWKDYSADNESTTVIKKVDPKR